MPLLAGMLGCAMQRVTISLDEDLAAAFDKLVATTGYQSRSEAVRDLVREKVEKRRLARDDDGLCVASLSYVYDHHVRDLATRLVEVQHTHHDLVIATTHVHLDHDTCLETTLLKGPAKAVRALSDAISAERGVRFAEINLISVTANDDHGAAVTHHHHGHAHLTPPKG